MGEDGHDAGKVWPRLIDDQIRGSLAPYVDERHRHTIDVLTLTLVAGRHLEAWLSETVAARDLDTSGFIALAVLWLDGPPHRVSAGELARRIVQTSGGATKTMQRLVDRRLVRRVPDLEDGRRSLLELTSEGLTLAQETLVLTLDAFDSEIGDLDEAAREGVAVAVHRLLSELSELLGR